MSSIFPNINETVRDRYHIKKESDAGSNSRSYKAVDSNTDSLVSLKIQQIDESVLPLLPDIKSEAEYFKKCDFPNIVKINDVFIEKERLIISMHYIEGHSLMSANKELGTFSAEYVQHIAEVLLEGLISLHKEGIVHQNINPAHILFDTKGKIWLTDILSSHNYAFTRFKSPKNISLPYVPPEVYNHFETDTRWDIYSLGMCLFYALTGDLPQEIKTMFTFGQKNGIDPNKFGLEIPHNLAHAIKKATSANPADRFPTAESFLETIRNPELINQEMLFFDMSCYNCLCCKEEVNEKAGVCALCENQSAKPDSHALFISSTSEQGTLKETRKNLKNFLQTGTNAKELNEAALGQRPVLFCSEELCEKILLHMKEHSLIGKERKRSLTNLLPADISILILIIFALSVYAHLLISSDYLVTGILMCSSLAYFGYSTHARSLLTCSTPGSHVPDEIRDKFAPSRKSLSVSNMRVLSGRTLLLAEQLYKIPELDSFQLSRLLLHMNKTLESVSKIHQTITTTTAVKQSSDHPSQLAEFRRALHKNFLSILKIYELLTALKIHSLTKPDHIEEFHLEEKVDQII